MASKLFEVRSVPKLPLARPRIDHRDFVSITDFSPGELHGALQLAMLLKAHPMDFRGALDGKMVVLFFEKPSLRTRLTFEAGVNSLGGKTFFVDQTHSRLGEREPIHDMAKNLERWVHGLVLRTFHHETVEEFALHATIPVLNGLSDVEHPCQALADMLTVAERFGDLSNVRLAYIGDGNNVAHSLVLAAVSLGSSISIATPKGYEPDRALLVQAAGIAKATGGSVTVTNDPREAVEGADAVYTDVWASMGQEEEALERERIFAPFCVDSDLMSLAAPHAIFMHCLPAHRGSEVSAAVIDGPSSVVFDQAENRLHVQKAVLLQLLGSDMRRFGPHRA